MISLLLDSAYGIEPERKEDHEALTELPRVVVANKE